MFAREHRVIAFDLPGFGESEMPAREDHDLRLRALRRGAARRARRRQRRGGGQLDGRLHRHRARDPLPRARRAAGARERGGPVDRVPAQRARARACSARSSNRLAAYSGWLASRSDALARRPGARRLIFGIVAHRPDRLPGPLVAEQVRGSGKPGFVPALDALTDYPIRDRLGEIACPTLIVWGAEDKLVPARDADEFARLIPNSRKVVWPDTGHVAMLERPAAFNALLEAFLAEEPGERVGARDAAGAA